MTEPKDSGGALGRRQLLVAGGTSISLGALLAACGGGSADEPGRVGYAPAPTALPTEVIDDAVLLRTAQSIELMIVDVYGSVTDTGALSGATADLLARLVEDHTATAAEVADLATEAGGEPYACANSWYTERIVPQIFERIDGNEARDIAPTDDEPRDLLAIMDAMESLAGAMYQGLVERLSQADRRAAVLRLAARSVRHSAAVAIASTGAPDAYFSPAVSGAEVLPDESGLIPLYAVPSQFATLSAYQLVIGAASSAGTRFTLSVETPADNSFVYTGQTCST